MAPKSLYGECANGSDLGFVNGDEISKLTFVILFDVKSFLIAYMIFFPDVVPNITASHPSAYQMKFTRCMMIILLQEKALTEEDSSTRNQIAMIQSMNVHPSVFHDYPKSLA